MGGGKKKCMHDWVYSVYYTQRTSEAPPQVYILYMHAAGTHFCHAANPCEWKTRKMFEIMHTNCGSGTYTWEKTKTQKKKMKKEEFQTHAKILLEHIYAGRKICVSVLFATADIESPILRIMYYIIFLLNSRFAYQELSHALDWNL